MWNPNHWTTVPLHLSLSVPVSLPTSSVSISFPLWTFPPSSLSCCTASDPPLSFLPLFVFPPTPQSLLTTFLPSLSICLSLPLIFSLRLKSMFKTLLSGIIRISSLACSEKKGFRREGPVMWGWGLRVLELGGPARWQGAEGHFLSLKEGPHPPNQTGKCDVRVGSKGGRPEQRKSDTSPG